jgi:membrane protein DedA with SNARE-associated domain
MALGEATCAVLEFARQHSNLAIGVVFVLAFGESLAFVSLILPFFAILAGIGAVIGVADPLLFWSIVVGAAVGAALGDWVSYWLGYHYHEEIQNKWPLKNHPKLIANGRKFFERYGAWAIVLGRFLGPLRASVPIAAGIAEMRRWQFQLANWTSAFLWAFVVLYAGATGMKGFVWLLGDQAIKCPAL